MDRSEYKKEKNRWDVKSRHVISDSMALIEGQNEYLYHKLARTLAGSPIEKPTFHSGDDHADFFRILLTENEMQDLIDLLFDLEAAAVPQGDGLGLESEAIQAREASRIASLVDEWNKLNLE